jgi:hypothetical protein
LALNITERQASALGAATAGPAEADPLSLAQEALSLVREAVAVSAPAVGRNPDDFDRAEEPVDVPAPPPATVTAAPPAAPAPVAAAPAAPSPAAASSEDTLLKGIGVGAALTAGGAEAKRRMNKSGVTRSFDGTKGTGTKTGKPTLTLLQKLKPSNLSTSLNTKLNLGHLKDAFTGIRWLRFLGPAATIGFAGWEVHRFFQAQKDPEASTQKKVLRGVAMGMSAISAGAMVGSVWSGPLFPLAFTVSLGTGIGAAAASIAADMS